MVTPIVIKLTEAETSTISSKGVAVYHPVLFLTMV